MLFFRYFEGIFEIARQRAVGNAEVQTNLFEKIPNPFGIFLLSAFFGLVGFFYEVYGKFEPIIALSLKKRDFFFQILFSENELLFFTAINSYLSGASIKLAYQKFPPKKIVRSPKNKKAKQIIFSFKKNYARKK